MFIGVWLSQYVSRCLNIAVCLSVSGYRCMFIDVWLSLYVYRCLAIAVCLSVSGYRCMFIGVDVWLSLYVYRGLGTLYVYRCRCLAIAVCLSVSGYRCIFIGVILSVSIFARLTRTVTLPEELTKPINIIVSHASDLCKDCLDIEIDRLIDTVFRLTN